MVRKKTIVTLPSPHVERLVLVRTTAPAIKVMSGMGEHAQVSGCLLVFRFVGPSWLPYEAIPNPPNLCRSLYENFLCQISNLKLERVKFLHM